ncbi:MAG TPA: hypothetical protein PKE26_02850 [Kiritimatiellia bacterium]|nr:hypothetical protein [Kiritimatiellia bacterium]HMO98027.1 hypothetical protein [Kiritimatiellia bacterium]HMP96552.1 hypothetical protein [Kiritimatiellia bacterium]
MNRIRFVAWIVALALLGGFLVACWPTDQRKVARQTRAFLNAVAKNGPESLPVSAARAYEAASHVGPELTLRLGDPFPARLTKSEFTSLLQQVRGRADRLDMKSRGVEIHRQEDGMLVDVTLEATVALQGRRESMIGTYRLLWVRMDTAWRLTRVEALNVIQHPQATSWW